MAHLGKSADGHLAKIADGHLEKCIVPCPADMDACPNGYTLVISGSSGCWYQDFNDDWQTDIDGTYYLVKSEAWCGAHGFPICWGVRTVRVQVNLFCLSSWWYLRVGWGYTGAMKWVAQWTEESSLCPALGAYLIYACACTNCGVATVSET